MIAIPGWTASSGTTPIANENEQTGKHHWQDFVYVYDYNHGSKYKQNPQKEEERENYALS